MARTFADAVDVYPGGLSTFALDMGESLQVISNWKVRGVPPNRCKAVERLLGISVRHLRPQDWRDYWPDERTTGPGALDAAEQGT